MVSYRFQPSVYMSPNTAYSGSYGIEALNNSRHNVSKSEDMIKSCPLSGINGGGIKRRTKRKKYKKRTSKIRKKYKKRTSKIRKKNKRRTSKIKNKY